MVCSGLDTAGVKRSAHTFAVLITPLQVPVVYNLLVCRC